jgi:hypothetical protein
LGCLAENELLKQRDFAAGKLSNQYFQCANGGLRGIVVAMRAIVGLIRPKGVSW